MAVAIERPGRDEYPEFYQGYVGRVPDGDVLEILAGQLDELRGMLGELSDSQAEFAFAPGEWTIKEVIGHLVDAERLFASRAYTFSRDTSAEMPGMDQDDYVREGKFERWSLNDLLDELESLRRANVLSFGYLTPEQTERQGVANGNPFTVRALVHILAGHFNYHLEDLQEKYLPGMAQMGASA